MAFVAASVGAAVGLTGTAAVIGGGMIIGAGAGALYSGITGDGDILNSALTGAAIGGVAGIGAAAAGSGAVAGGAAAPSTLAAPTANVLTSVPTASLTSANTAALDALAASQGVFAEGAAALPGAGLNAAPAVIGAQPVPTAATTAAQKTAEGLSNKEILGYGLAGSAALSLMGGMNQPKIQTPSSTSYIRPSTYAQTRNPNWGQPGEAYYTQGYTTGTPYKAAAGGLMAIGGPVERMGQVNAGQGTYPQAFLNNAAYSTPSQMPTSEEVMQSDYEPKTDPYTGSMVRMAEGGQTQDPNQFVNMFNELQASNPAPTRAVSPDVTAYQNLLNQRSKAEYVDSPQLAAFRAAPPVAAAPATPDAPAVSQDINGLYQYYLGRQPGADEIGQWSSKINGPVTPDMAQYFQQFTGPELAKSGYKPTGPDPFLGQGTVGPAAGLPQYTYNKATNSYSQAPSRMPIADPMAGYDPVVLQSMYSDYQNRMNQNNSGGGAAGGLMPTSLRFDRGGKAESNDLSEKEKKKILFDFIANSLERRPGEEYSGMSVPQGAYGRAGVSADMADNSRLRAGLSGVAMAVPGQHGVRTMPGAVDIGYTTARNSDYDPYLDLSASRSINPMPGKGHAQSVNARYTVPFVQGGQAGYNLGGYSDGGRLLKGPGDGMSDNIPASIGDRQPARLADGEFVVPADVVSHLGNGSTDAGAKKLYAMMDNVRKARTGTKKQGKQIKAEKYLKA